MAGKIGIWIDHRKAILVSINNGVEEVHEIESDVEKHVRDAGGSGSGSSHGSQDVVAGDKRDRKMRVRQEDLRLRRGLAALDC